MSKLCNLYKNATLGMVKFLEIEYNSPAKPQYEYVDHTIVINLRRDEIYSLDRYHKLMISVSSNGIIAFSDCEYFAYVDDGHTLSLLFNNNAYNRNLSIEVEGNDLGNVKFTELSVISSYNAINPFINNIQSNNIFGYISNNATKRTITTDETLYLPCLAYSPYVVGELSTGKQCVLYGEQSYNLTNLTITLEKTIKDNDKIDIIYIYKITTASNDSIQLW